MKKGFLKKIKPLQSNIYVFFVLRILLVLFLWFISQLAFYLHNTDMYGLQGMGEFWRLFGGGLRFALSALLFLLFPFLILNIIPLKIKYKRPYQIVADVFYYLVAIGFFLANCIDIVYVRYTFKRMTADTFSYFTVAGDFFSLLPSFIADFWYVFLLFVFGVFLLIFFTKRIKLNPQSTARKCFYLKEGIATLLIAFFSVIGMRGGFDYRPLSIYHAGEYTNHPDLVLNTPFTLIKTLGKTGVSEVHYFADKASLESVFNPIRHYDPILKNSDSLPNIVVVVLESFAAEYMGCLNGGMPSYTPFLDSLYEKSNSFRGMSNGKRSIEGIPAIVSGIIPLMNDAFITSVYAGNKSNSIAGYLRTKGYNTSFFHGGYNGTMGFDAFLSGVGFEDYYGMNEYNNQRDYDGQWGIFDEPFLQWTANQLKTKKEPFFTVAYTLSSHHPYTIPPQHQDKFDKGTLVTHESVMYSDYALKRFFDTVATAAWFNNSVFIITADHTAQLESPYYRSSVGLFEIPMFIYIPGQEKPIHSNEIVQQVDILPSILQYIGYDDSFVSFGNSLFDTAASSRYHVSFLNNTYQLIHDGYVLQFAEDRAFSLKKDDKNYHQNEELIDQLPEVAEQKEKLLKAIIQQYNHRMLNNELTE